MVKKLFISIAVLMTAVACNNNNPFETTDTEDVVYTSKVECEATQTRVYDENLNWIWQAGDAMRGYQLAGHNLRNTLSFISESASFVCEAFNYMSTDPESFHFIYPAEAEVAEGVLVAPQSGVWRPLSVTTVENALIGSLPTLKFEVLSAAFELRIFGEDKATPVEVCGAKITAENDFVGKWTLQSDMTYTQSLDGKQMEVDEGSDWACSIVVFNMPDLPEGVAEGALTLTLTDEQGGTMTRALPAMTFVKGKRTVLNVVYTADATEDGGDEPDQPDEPIIPEPDKPETITGTFTCATYNVDGLPEKVLSIITLNGDGPGSDGTKQISQKIATSGWDVVTFQENFSYNSELQSTMSSYYTFGTHRKFSLLSALGTADTDGLGFATLNETCSFSGEKYVEFTDKLGGLTNELDGGNGGGANTSIKKGIRHYVVTFSDANVVVDVLVTHMNTAETEEQIKVQDKQLQQVADYINSIRNNNRPIIFMGDLNTRYTRNDMFGCLFNKLEGGLTCADPWVEFMWDGVYPTYGSSSIMTGDYGMQKGEVVDKIIYINNPAAKVQIKANNYLHDDSYTFADHKPVVSEFTYTYDAE